MKPETKIAQLLRVAESRVTYCEIIIGYRQKIKGADFDHRNPVDNFYKNVCVMAFNDAVLILGSLLDKDRRVISFENCTKFNKKDDLRKLQKFFESTELKRIRDQIIAHQDEDHPHNDNPQAKITGYINPVLIRLTRKLLNRSIKLFFDQMAIFEDKYDPTYFKSDEYREQIQSVIESAPPKLNKKHQERE